MALTNTAALGTGGATIGSYFGPFGALVGAGVGALGGGLADWSEAHDKKKAARALTGGKGGKTTQFNKTNMPGVSQYSKLTPEQQLLQNQAIQNALQILQTGNAPGFQPIADEARANFATKTVPSLAERFGGGGMETGSSALTGQLAAAGAGLDRGLATLRAQYGQNQLQSLFGPSLKTPFDLSYQKEDQPWWKQAGGEALENLPGIMKLWENYQKSRQGSGEDYQPVDLDSTRKALENLIPNVIQNGTQNQPGMPGYQYGQMPRPNFLGGGSY